MLTSDEFQRRKGEKGTQNFQASARVARIRVEPGSERNVAPPEADICCKIDGTLYYFELGEITEVARNLAIAIRADEPRGGAFSQDRPFASILIKKAKKEYVTSGAPVDLLLYYRTQYPPWHGGPERARFLPPLSRR